MFGASLKYINAEELAARIKAEEQAAGKVVVVDVRGSGEFNEGHIKGALHLPSTSWSNISFVDDLISGYATGEEAAGRSIVLHCAYSQQRGPTCARILLDRMNAMVEAGTLDGNKLPDIQVLSGGFVTYDAKFGEDSTLVEDQS